MLRRMHQHGETLATGGLGLLATIGSFLMSLMEIEASLRVVSLLVGICVGLVTLRKLWKEAAK